MRYAKTHKDETRQKLLQSSRAIAKKGGFKATGVDALMASIGLSGGAFYSHFPSKQALFEALVQEEMAHSSAMLAGDSDSPDNHVAKCLRDYLSSFHAMNPEVGCVLPTLGPEIAQAGPEVRSAVEAALKLARQYWAERGKPTKRKVIARTPGYHGNTLYALSASGRPHYKKWFGPMLSEVLTVSAPALTVWVRNANANQRAVVMARLRLLTGLDAPAPPKVGEWRSR